MVEEVINTDAVIDTEEMALDEKVKDFPTIGVK